MLLKQEGWGSNERMRRTPKEEDEAAQPLEYTTVSRAKRPPLTHKRKGWAAH